MSDQHSTGGEADNCWARKVRQCVRYEGWLSEHGVADLKGVLQALVKPGRLCVIPSVLYTSALPRGLWHPVLRKHVASSRLWRRRWRRSTISLLLPVRWLLLLLLLLWRRRRLGRSGSGVELDALVDRLLGDEMDDLVAFLRDARAALTRAERCEEEEEEEEEQEGSQLHSHQGSVKEGRWRQVQSE